MDSFCGRAPAAYPLTGNPAPIPTVQTLTRKPTALRDETLFERFEQAAISGERCPTMGQLRDEGYVDSSKSAQRLADSGAIRIEVYARNYRVIEIKLGPHEGRRTAPPPNEWHEPYYVREAGMKVDRRWDGS